MTMIAFNVRPNRVDVITDSSSYTFGAAEITFDRDDKLTAIPPLPAASITQGSGALGLIWRRVLENWETGGAYKVASFEDLISGHATLLPEAWKAAGDVDVHRDDSIVFFAGWDAEQQRCRAVGFLSIMDFAPVDLNEFVVMPPPLDLPQRGITGIGDVNMAAVIDAPAPNDPAGWARLAVNVRRQRTLIPNRPGGEKVIVGGQVNLTTITQQGIRTRPIHTFDDTGIEFDQLVHGTMHPRSLQLACDCGSGQAHGACCLNLDGPCVCRSGKTAANCCAIGYDQHAGAPAPNPFSATARSEPIHPGNTGRNDPCPCGSSTKYKRCCAMVPA